MDICRGRPDRVTKEKIKEHIFYHHLKHMKEELSSLKEKGKELHKVDIRKPQDYLASSSLEEARMAFRVQNRMLDIPGDMPGRYLGRENCEAWRPGGRRGRRWPPSPGNTWRSAGATHSCGRERTCVSLVTGRDISWLS